MREWWRCGAKVYTEGKCTSGKGMVLKVNAPCYQKCAGLKCRTWVSLTKKCWCEMMTWMGTYYKCSLSVIRWSENAENDLKEGCGWNWVLLEWPHSHIQKGCLNDVKKRRKKVTVVFVWLRRHRIGELHLTETLTSLPALLTHTHTHTHTHTYTECFTKKHLLQLSSFLLMLSDSTSR